MTRKDYVRFAAMFKSLRSQLMFLRNSGLVLENVANKTADIFEQDNPAFDRARFLKACGVDS